MRIIFFIMYMYILYHIYIMTTIDIIKKIYYDPASYGSLKKTLSGC